jgi:hypothetical protein
VRHEHHSIGGQGLDSGPPAEPDTKNA